MRGGLALAAAAALLVAGCGGGSVSARQFRLAATRVCRSATAQTALIATPATPSSAVLFLRRGVTVLTRELVGLRRLRAPHDMAPAYGTALSGFAGEVAALRPAIRALDRGADPLLTLPALQHRLGPIEARTDAAWRTLEVPACQSGGTAR